MGFNSGFKGLKQKMETFIEENQMIHNYTYYIITLHKQNGIYTNHRTSKTPKMGQCLYHS